MFCMFSYQWYANKAVNTKKSDLPLNLRSPISGPESRIGELQGPFQAKVTGTILLRREDLSL